MKKMLVLVLALVLGAPIAASSGVRRPCPLLAGIDVAHYLGGPAAFVSPDLKDSICLARRGIGEATILARVQDDKVIAAGDPERKTSIPLLCKIPDALTCVAARKSVGLTSARQSFDLYRSVMQRAHGYRTLSGVGDEAFEYGVDAADARGATTFAMYHGSIVGITLIGSKIATDTALRQLPELARAVVANVK